MKIYPLPTGSLFVDDYSKGPLETLSIGDYGKAHNVKADFLGYTRRIEGVPDTFCMPLSEKWVVTLSTQYGCVMACTFCDVPKVEWKGNASVEDLQKQLYSAISLYPETRYTERLNIHFARMGEPIFNQNVLEFGAHLSTASAKKKLHEDTGLRVEVIHPVLTTSLPNNFAKVYDRILQWCDIKNQQYRGQAGLQFSINSTSAEQRSEMFGGMALDLDEFSRFARTMPDPIGRKYCLNFAYSTDFEIDARYLRDRFDPEKFMVKITPIHNNNACTDNGIKTIGGYDSYVPYEKPERDLIEVGFDVLVFVPSMDEEKGLVTCGNAILGGSDLKITTDRPKIHGALNAAEVEMIG